MTIVSRTSLCALAVGMFFFNSQSALPQAAAPAHEHHEQAPSSPEHSHHQQPQTAPEVFFPMADQPQMEMHHHGEIPEVQPQLPQLGHSQQAIPGPVYKLEDLELMAAGHNPTLAQAQNQVEAARGRERQSGMYPNPTIGYTGEEIRGGVYGGGEQGFFIEQPIILGGKLGLSRKVGAAEVKERQVEAAAQRYRVENDVLMTYYRVLAAQERMAIDRDLDGIAQKTVGVMHQLGNIGQADETEILEAEAEEQRMALAAEVDVHVLHRCWLEMVAVMGVPSLPEGSVEGRLDADLPVLDDQKLLASLLSESPAVQSARVAVEHAEAALRRAQHEPAPDLTIKAGLQQNNELLEGIPGQHVGLQGFAEIGLHLSLWDRNQGAIKAERATLEVAQADLVRVELSLRQRAAMYTESYRSARLTAERYRSAILPRLERAYSLMNEQYGNMTASFVRVLNLQRMLYENETGYIDALEQTWRSSVALRGFLLEGSLAAADAAEMPDSMKELRPAAGMFGEAGLMAK